MFEQSSYEQVPVQYRQEGELFGKYEIRNWELSPRLYKIIGMSALANILALLIVAQTSLLTMKGCDSPLVGSVCQVLDTVYVSSLLFGTEREYADAVYEKTELEDADITFVDVSGVTPPLSYPEGYFQVANPDEFAAMQQGLTDPLMSSGIPGIPSGIPMSPSPSGGSRLLDTKPITPRRNDDVVDGDLPTSLGSDPTTNPIATANGRKGQRPGKVTNIPQRNPDGTIPGFPGIKADTPTTPAPTPDPSADADLAEPDKNGIFLNKRPLKDFAEVVKPKPEVITPNATFKIVLSADLGHAKDKNGKETDAWVLKNVKPVESVAGSKESVEMAKIAQQGILAVGDSGWFGYLAGPFKVKKVLITVIQDDTDFKFIVRSDQPNEALAGTVASGINGFISIGKMGAEGDVKTFLERANSTADGKAFIFNFAMPKAEMLDMIKRKLAEPDKKDNSAAQRQVSESTSAQK